MRHVSKELVLGSLAVGTRPGRDPRSGAEARWSDADNDSGCCLDRRCRHAAGHELDLLVGPRENAVVRRLGVKVTTVVALVARGPAIWASGWESIVKLSPAGRILFRQGIGGVAFSIAFGPDGVWGAQQFFGRKYRKPQPLARRLVRITTSPRHLAVVPLDATPGAVASAAGATWVVFFPDQRRRAILRVSGTPPVPETVPMRGLPGAIAPASDGVWVAERDPNELSKVC